MAMFAFDKPEGIVWDLFFRVYWESGYCLVAEVEELPEVVGAASATLHGISNGIIYL